MPLEIFGTLSFSTSTMYDILFNILFLYWNCRVVLDLFDGIKNTFRYSFSPIFTTLHLTFLLCFIDISGIYKNLSASGFIDKFRFVLVALIAILCLANIIKILANEIKYKNLLKKKPLEEQYKEMKASAYVYEEDDKEVESRGLVVKNIFISIIRDIISIGMIFLYPIIKELIINGKNTFAITSDKFAFVYYLLISLFIWLLTNLLTDTLNKTKLFEKTNCAEALMNKIVN